MASTTTSRKPENMSRPVGNTITLIAFFGPALLFAVFGYAIGSLWTAAGFSVLWLSTSFAASFKIRRKRTFLVVERFGYFWDIKRAGPRIVIPFIDNPILEDTLVQKSVPLFRNARGNEGGATIIEIDFADGSAPVDAEGWYQIANPQDIDDKEKEDAVRDQILKYTYVVLDSERTSRIAEIYQGAFRAILENNLKITEAQSQMEELARKGTESARTALKEIGVYPFPEKGIIVRDIDLPQKIIDLREQALEGEMEARKAVNASLGLWGPVLHMKAGLQRGLPAQGSLPAVAGMQISDAEVVGLFLKQKGFETLKGVNKLDIVASDVDNAVKTITVGSTQP